MFWPSPGLARRAGGDMRVRSSLLSAAGAQSFSWSQGRKPTMLPHAGLLRALKQGAVDLPSQKPGGSEGMTKRLAQTGSKQDWHGGAPDLRGLHRQETLARESAIEPGECASDCRTSTTARRDVPVSRVFWPGCAPAPSRTGPAPAPALFPGRARRRGSPPRARQALCLS